MPATLDAVRRETFGRNESGRLRRQGRIPAVIYGGPSGQVETLAVDPKALMQILHSDSGVNTLISLKVEAAGEAQVLVKEYQLDPVNHTLLHVDFYRVAMDKTLHVTVPIRLTGEAKGVKTQGGILDFVHRDLIIECLPGSIPEHVSVDVTDLMLHQGVRVRDLQTGGAWKPVSEPDLLIVHVVSPRVEQEPAPVEAVPVVVPAAPTEPEVIKKGKAEQPEEETE